MNIHYIVLVNLEIAQKSVVVDLFNGCLSLQQWTGAIAVAASLGKPEGASVGQHTAR